MHTFQNVLFLLVLLFLSSINGCQWANVVIPESKKEADNGLGGQLTLYLKGEEPIRKLSFEIKGIEIQQEDGSWIPLKDSAKSVEAQELGKKEVFLWEDWLSPGRYQSLKLILGEAYTGKTVLASKNTLILPFHIILPARKNITASLIWKAGHSLKDKSVFEPDISIEIKRFQAPEQFLLYVSNRSSNNITAIDRLKGRIIGTILVGSQPKGLAVSPDRTRLYVANSGSNTISVIDARNGERLKDFYLQFGLEPVDLALSPDGGRLYVISSLSNNLAIVNALGGGGEHDIQLGTKPTNLLVSPRGDKVFVACEGTNNIYVIDPLQGQIINTLTTGSSPKGMVLDIRGERLFVANKTTGNISIIDLKSNRIVKSFFLGYNIGEIALDQTTGKLYIADEDNWSLMVVLRRMEGIRSRIILPAKPQDIEIDSQRREVYILTSAGEIITVDLASEREIRRMYAGKDPYEIALLGLFPLF